MRILVFAYHNVGYICLKELLSLKENVVAVFTHLDNPSENIWFNSVYELAEKSNIPVFCPADLKNTLIYNRIKEFAPDIIFSFYYRYIIPEDILEIPPHGAINLHGSLLPKYRGRCPVNWVLINGENVTGVTLHYMEKTPDSGGIISQQEVIISDDDDAFTLFNKITEAAHILFKNTWPIIKYGNFNRIPQDQSEATYFSGRKPEDGLIEWKKSSLEIHNLIRGVTHPYPGAFTFYRKRKLFIWKSEIVQYENYSKKIPGTIIETGYKTGVVVKTGKGCIKLKSIQFQNEEEINLEKFDKELPFNNAEVLGN